MTLPRLLVVALLAVALACGAAWGFSATRPVAIGASGLPGPTGSPGPDGAAGAIGPAGEAGPAGAPGPQGPAGPTGAQGAPGAVGPVGATGATGARGASGPVGERGAAGPRGATGDPGPTGADGPEGASGPDGSAGPTGPMSVIAISTEDQSGQTEPFALPAGLWLLTASATLSAGSSDIVLVCQLAVNAPVGESATQDYFAGGGQDRDSTVTYEGAVVFFSDGNAARTVYTQCTSPVPFTVDRITTTATRVTELTP